MVNENPEKWKTYTKEMSCFHRGDALWTPYTGINIGDIGYIHNGRFELLFPSSPPSGGRRPGVHVPTTFKELFVGDWISDLLEPGCYHSDVEPGEGRNRTRTFTPLPQDETEMFIFDLTGSQGAALVTRHPIHYKDSLVSSRDRFDRYLNGNRDFWAELAKRKALPKKIQPVLVYGFDAAKDFEMVSYPNSDSALFGPIKGFVTSLMFKSIPPPFQGQWCFKTAPHIQQGSSTDFDQCVFVRYHTIRRKGDADKIPKVMKGGAGPHDLGSGDNQGETFPELTVQYGVDSSINFGKDPGGQPGSIAEETDLGPGSIIQQTQGDVEHDKWDVIADYIFQNSNAVTALMHHRDLEEILTAGNVDDLPALLEKRRPRVVEQGGVGRIVLQEPQQPAKPTPAPTSYIQQLGGHDPSDVDFASLSTEDLVGLAKDFVDALPLVSRDPQISRVENSWVDLISEMVSRAGTSPMDLSPQDVVVLAETFRQALLYPNLENSSIRDLWIRTYVNALLRESRVFPDIELPIQSLEFDPLGFVDGWRASYDGRPVCIKAVRTRNKFHLEEIEKTFTDGVRGYKHFTHPNVLPAVQVLGVLFPFFIMSPWMPEGNIVQYTRKNSNANRLLLLTDVCNGLLYLHGLDVVHGCIAPGNILITVDGRACLGDFGIAGAFSDLPFSKFKLETARYMAPERLDQMSCSPSKKGDVYSLAMTSFTVMTGNLPYDDIRDHRTLIDRIKSGERPSRSRNPDGVRWLRDGVWDMVRICWNKDPDKRWEVSAMLDLLQTLNLQEAQEVRSDIQKGGQRHSGRLRSRITGLFQSLLTPEPKTERLVNEMDERLENESMSNLERVKLINKLCKICGRSRVIPKSMHIPDYSKNAAQQLYRGGFSDIFQSRYEGHQVAVKIVRISGNERDSVVSRFCREAVAWKYLRHPNIIPLFGAMVTEDQIAMVSEWMDNGNINEFIQKDPDANRIALLADVADGLRYMHDLQIVHGDVKGANILINKDRRACLTDFTLTRIAGTTSEGSPTSTFSDDTLMPFTPGGTYRWMSPERLDPEQFGIPDERPTRQSDCYAFGMVIYEVLYGHCPFAQMGNQVSVMVAVLQGERPAKPEGAACLGFSTELWMMVEQCWRRNRAERPKIEDILTCLSDATAFWYTRPTNLAAGGGALRG